MSHFYLTLYCYIIQLRLLAVNRYRKD
ncbi:hypothetical protein SaSA20_0847a [Streptococcus agalactiae]|nr:hypothetical protein SaSA20_0847a [Streptococcus agalactiae]